MAIDKETLNFDKNYSGEVFGSINVEDCSINCEFKFHKERNVIRIDHAWHYNINLKAAIHGNDVFLGIEDEIYEAIEELENADID